MKKNRNVLYILELNKEEEEKKFQLSINNTIVEQTIWTHTHIIFYLVRKSSGELKFMDFCFFSSFFEFVFGSFIKIE